MKIKMRYDNEYQTIEVEATELENWLNISISDDESQEDYEKRIQDVFEEQFNRPEYNNWHKYNRHRGDVIIKSINSSDEVNSEEAIMVNCTDDSDYYKSTDEIDDSFDYDYYCEIIRKILKEKNAEMVIAIVLDGMSVEEYAGLIGEKANTVSHRYRRALEKLKKLF